MNEGFYRAFEERYRGSRELIKGRLTAYLPFVEPLLEVLSRCSGHRSRLWSGRVAGAPHRVRFHAEGRRPRYRHA